MESLNILVQPFFEWLLRATMQASLLICLILLLQLILRGKLGARGCHALWLLLLIRMVMPWAPQSRASIFNLVPQSFSGSGAEYARRGLADETSRSAVTNAGASDTSSVSTTAAPQETPKTTTETAKIREQALNGSKLAFVEVADVFPFVWLAGAVALAIYVCANNFTLLRIVRRERPLTDQKILELLEDCKAEMGIRTILGVVPTDKVKSAALFGFIRPRLLLPVGMIETLSREELRYVFLHELAHLKRHDIYLGWLTSLLQVLHWFNPLIWLAFYRMRADRELACDALVLARTQGDDSKNYGRTVVSLLERFSRSQRLPAMAGILETKAQLKRRITMIAQFKKKSYQWSPLAVLLIAVMSCVALPDAVGSKKSGVSWPESEPSISLRRVKVGAGSPLLSPPSLDGRYICDFHWPNVLIRDLATGEVRPLIDAGKAGAAAVIESRISPNNEYVAYFVVMVNKKNELRLVKMDGTGDRLLYRCENSEWIFLSGWSPDGKRILGTLYTSAKGCLVWISVEDGSMEVIHTPDRAVHSACLSPDGRYIAYNPPQEKGSPKHDIFFFDIEEQKEECVVQHSAHDKLLGWTPDGNYIFFASDRRIGTPGGRAITDTWDAYLVLVSQGKRNGPAQLVKRNIEGKLVPKGFTRDGSYYYAVEFRAEEVFVVELDLKTGKLLTEPQPVGQTGANHVASWSPDGRHLAYCTIHPNLSQTIHIRNLETGQERTLDPNLPPFNSLRWSPDGESLLVANFDKESPQAIYRIHAQTGERITLLRSESSDLVLGEPQLSPDQSTLFYTRQYYASKKTQVIARDPETGDEKELLVDEMRTLDLTLSPDGRRLALAFQPPGFGLRILTIPVEGGQPKELLKTKAWGMRPAIEWTPDGESLLFWKRGPEGNKFWLIPADGGQARELCDLDLRKTLDMHPDGKRIVFDTSDTRHEVWVMENFLPGMPVAKPEALPEPTLQRIEVRGPGRVHSGPSFDGKYMSDVDDTGNLVVRELGTGKVRKLTKKGSWSESKDFAHKSLISPDTARVAYLWFNTEKEDFDLRVVGFDGSDDRLLWGAEEGARAFNMGVWSPDGKHILGKLIGQDEHVELVRVSTDDGSRQVIKTFDGKWLFKVDISRDGRYVAYDLGENKTSNRDIFVFDLDQNRETPLVNHPANDKLLGWTPDGQYVFFTSDRNGTWDGWLLRVVDGKPHGLPEVVKPGIGDVSPIGFTRSGSFYYEFWHEAWNVYTAKLDLDTGKVLSEPHPVRHVGKDVRPDWSPDSQYLAYLSQPDRNKTQIIRIRTLATGQERELKTDLPHFDWLRWCPGSRHLLITSFRRGSPSVVYRIDVQTGERTALVQSDKQRIRGAELSADGKTLAYRIRGSGNANWLIVRDMETGREKELLRTGAMGATILSPFSGGWALSPDGEHVALSLREGEVNKPLKPLVLKIMSVESGEARMVAGASVGELAWTSDGRDLLFAKDGNELWRVSAKGGEPRKLWEWKQMLWGPRIHPDGQRIAFFGGGNMSEMWVMENFLPGD